MELSTESTPVIVDTPRDRHLVSLIVRIRSNGVRETNFWY